MIRRLLATAVAAAIAVGGGGAALAAGPKPRIVDLDLRLQGDELLVGFALDGAVGQEVLEQIESGIPLTFDHRVELLSRRALGLWPSKTVARLKVSTTVSYDALTRRYDLERRVETRPAEDARPTVTEGRRSTERLAEAKAWLTDLRDLPPLTVPDGGHLRLRVESLLGRRYVLFLFPARVSIRVERRLER